jgi:hypothetical protein
MACFNFEVEKCEDDEDSIIEDKENHNPLDTVDRLMLSNHEKRMRLHYLRKKVSFQLENVPNCYEITLELLLTCEIETTGRIGRTS